jgi:hypothetical protein
MSNTKKSLDKNAEVTAYLARSLDAPRLGGLNKGAITISMENYQNLFQVGHTLIRQQFLKQDLPTHEFAERACCDHDRLERFLEFKEPLSGREWSNIVAELKINVDDWIEIASASPVPSVQPRAMVGCGMTIDPTTDKHIKTVLGILGDFYRQATQNFRDHNRNNVSEPVPA